MPVDIIERFEQMLAKGQDNAMLRFSLGNAYFAAKEFGKAATHLDAAVRHDANYSVAWKLLGRSYSALGESEKALATYQQGLAVAQAKGDMQVVKELEVFMRREQKNLTKE
ncbi:tetratricopeptide repeat protein [Pseudomonas sp. F1_0610]|uniref:tetratricopeptide repeat protein n=1 Tax=Pseudomonas sp. F1_0610 TaxID=3114284 RepID=UPI0039C081A6